MNRNGTKYFQNGPKGFRKSTKCYPILDIDLVLRGIVPAQRHHHLYKVVADLAAAGVEILQYRNKRDPDATVLEDARVMQEAIRETASSKPEAAKPMRLILNDRVHLFDPNLFDGLHVGQDDSPPSEARALISPNRNADPGSGPILGLSTHNDAQVLAADHEPVDYIAIGPVFSTLTKSDTEPVIGLEGVRRARALTSKPLVAIGGITLANAAQVLAAGADSLAIISAIFATPNPAQSARDFLAVFK